MFAATREAFVTTRLLPLLVAGLLSAQARADDKPAETWWSFRPLVRPVVPKADPAWGRTPIDAFVLAKLREKGLSPAPEADRRTLIRRLTFDLTGLPPTPAEIDAFVNDPSPDAYEKVVDRLLASPHYGERWARHWMDAAHFAETHGHDQDRVRPNAWRYRDYLIDAFNTDRAYSRFVKEQVAADVLFPDRPELTPALGFLAAGPWDESSLRDIREDSIDRQVGYYLDRDDMVTTVMATFQGLTVQCARCHDHKFDPIPQADYYALQAVFAGVGRGDTPFDPDAKLAARRAELLAKLAALDRNDPALVAKFDAPEFRRDLAAREAKQGGPPVRWDVIRGTATSQHGATLTPQPDGSVRSEGTRPEKDTYTVTARVRVKGVTAVRLELLTDDALPHRGPGRQDNGNLHLSEMVITAAPVLDGKAGAAKPITIRSASSDYDQPDWTVQHAFDGNTATAWGIYPQVGKPHEAVFELAEPIGDGEFDVTVKLEQLHGGGHLIGRFRLSVTSAPSPGRASVLPNAIRDALATPAEKRTPQQWRDLGRHSLRETTAAELAALPKPLLVYAASSRFNPDAGHKPTPDPRPVHMLKRGDIRKPADAATPGTVSCLPGLTDRFELPKATTEGDRRAALAAVLTDPVNPLTWRVIANRVWHHHFGRGIVDTPNDFGKMGGAPTHPELLDWLAVEFRDGGQSLKKLHRLIVTSAAYRQSSRHDPKAAALDGDARLLWRMPRAKLDAEEVRDAMLFAAGRLDLTRGGPSDQQFAMKPGLHVTPVVEYGKFDWDRPPGHRRSVYRFVFRTLPDPLIACLDGADASQLTPVRTASVTAPQALALLNDDFVLAAAKAMAGDLEKRFPDRGARIDEACRRLWGRPPTAAEQAALKDHATKHGLANVCRVLFNTNEFLFLD